MEMKKRKKRILIVNEAHFLYTGFAKYGKEILKRLAATGKYELAELGCYGEMADARLPVNELKWKYYGNMPDASMIKKSQLAAPNNRLTTEEQKKLEEQKKQKDIYDTTADAPFGRWRFERVCLDFKPDFVIDVRDPWMIKAVVNSQLRDFFHLVLMPTVDSAPQKPEFIYDFESADGILVYTEYGKRVLEEQSEKIKVFSSAPPGVDINQFRPLNKDKCREHFGLDKEMIIFGTIMRNQMRKLYPDLFEAFKKYLDLCYENGNAEIAKRSYLHIHCGYPDSGWDIPQFIRDIGISNNVLMTQVCSKCKNPTMGLFSNFPICKCGSMCGFPSTSMATSDANLARIINTYDAYIQYSVCEGFGMPQVEAAACGIPVMTPNYSAMEDILNYSKGIEIPIKTMFWDNGTHAKRLIPDNEVFAKNLYDFALLPQSAKRHLGISSRIATEKHWNWDNTAKVWEDYIDNAELTGLQGKWEDTPAKTFSKIPETVPDNLSDSEFCKWVIVNIAQKPELLNTYFEKIMTLRIMYRHRITDRSAFSRQMFVDLCTAMHRNSIDCESGRVNPNSLLQQDYIDYANKLYDHVQKVNN